MDRVELYVERIRGTPDFLLLFSTLALVGFGIIMVFSASSILSYWKYGDYWFFARKQILFAIIGFVLMLIAMNIPYKIYKKLYILIGIVSLFVMLLVFLPGVGIENNGARSWIEIGGQSMQPAEFAKLGLIIYLAAVITRKEERFRDFSHGLLPVLLIIFLFCIIVILQKDLGTSTIMLLTAGCMVICGGARLTHIIGLFLLILPFMAVFIFLEEYRIKRITSFLNPWEDPMNSGYQLIQSLYAIAHGEINGVGLGQSIQKYLYLPYPQTDFIFSVMAEELGLIGSILFLIVYIGLLWRALIVSLKAQDPFASLVGVGIVSMIAIQAFINIGGVTGSIPITGVPLPFISAGGSSLLVTMIGMGIILGISREANLNQIKKNKNP